LVIKVNAYPDSNNLSSDGNGRFRLSGEAKPIDFNTEKINTRIEEIEHKIDSLKIIKRLKMSRMDELNREISDTQESCRTQEITLANKKTHAENIAEQCNKIKAEEEVVVIELTDVDQELSVFNNVAYIVEVLMPSATMLTGLAYRVKLR